MGKLRRVWEWIGHVSTAIFLLEWWHAGFAFATAVVATLLSSLSDENPIARFALGLSVFASVLFIFALVGFLRNQRRVRGIEFFGPEIVIDNRNEQRREVQLARVGVRNVHGKPLRNCSVRMISMKDSHGRESRELMRFLWLSRQRGNLDPNGPHPIQDKKFDLSIDGEELVDVIFVDPIKSTHIRVCYARDRSDREVFINYGGVVAKCPYTMILRVTCDTVRSALIRLQYHVDGFGRLVLIRIE